MNFSQRLGLAPIYKEIQLTSIDNDLRNSLWNVFLSNFLESLRNKHYTQYGVSLDSGRANVLKLLHYVLSKDYFKTPIDEVNHSFESDRIQSIKNYFFQASWNQLYDFIEFIISHSFLKTIYNYPLFEQEINEVLEREFSGYRLLDSKFVPISNQIEIEAIKDSISITDSFSKLKGANFHFKIALGLLSNRENPDYRNSIKESISAVEALAKVISGDDKAELGKAIDKIKGTLKLHGALAQGLKQIYGYTSDADGIRHGLMDEPNCDFEDAKFMLVSCSAFVNFLIMKAQKAGISFEK